MTVTTQKTAQTTQNTDQARPLRLALKVDAVASGATGLLMLGGARLLDEPLGAPPGLLLSCGIVLAAFAALVWWVGVSHPLNRSAAWAIVAVNGLWTLASVIAVLAGWFPFTVLGKVFVLLQAAVVMVLADWQVIRLRKG